MKKLLYAMLVAVATLGATSCKKDPNLPTPSVEEFPQIFTKITAQSTFKVADAQGTGNPTATFNIEVKGGDANEVESIQVYRTFRAFNVPNAAVPPATAAAPVVALGGPTVLLKMVPPTSGSVEVTLNDLIAGLTRPTGPSQAGTRVPVTRASLKANEGFLFTYALLLKGGRRIEYNQSFNAAPFSGIVTIAP